MSRPQVTLREVGLRDGLQMVPQVLPTDVKLEWIRREHAAGIREIEATSFVPPKYAPQFFDAEEVVRASLAFPGLDVTAVILNLRGAERGLAAGAHKLSFVVSASESHNQRNARRSSAESLADFEAIAAMRHNTRPSVKLAGGIATAFGCTIEGSIDEAAVLRIAESYVRCGADELVFGDTVGYAHPTQVRRLLAGARRAFGDLPLALHLHDTRGLGMANAAAGLEEGVSRFDACLGGLGGCPHAPGATGNVVMEDLAFLCEAMGFSTGIDISKLLEVRAFAAIQLPDERMPGAIARAGLPKDFTFHESGSYAS